MTSATERLRELLDERGVEWWESKGYGTGIAYTFWNSPTFGRVHAIDNDDGRTLFMACLNNCDFTPEQAIAATLGAGEYQRGYDDGLRANTAAAFSAAKQAFGAGECELVETDSYSNPNEVIHVLECSACGETCEHVNGAYPRCPHCGAKAAGR